MLHSSTVLPKIRITDLWLQTTEEENSIYKKGNWEWQIK